MAKRKKKDAAVVSINSEHRKNIAKCIDFIGRVHSPWTVFSDFLAIAVKMLDYVYEGEMNDFCITPLGMKNMLRNLARPVSVLEVTLK